MPPPAEAPEAPEAVRRALSEVRKRDRRHFAEHPFRMGDAESWSYTRPSVEHEFWPETVPAGEPVLVGASRSSRVRVRRCGAVVAMDGDGTHPEMVALLRPPAGATVVKLRRGSMVVYRLDTGDPS